MDPTKFFEPVQKFTTYLVDRVSFFVVTCAIVLYLIGEAVVSSIASITPSPQPLLNSLEGVGFSGDALTVALITLFLLSLVAVLEVHERILQLLSMFSPVQFSTKSYGGADAFYGFAPLLWRGYCHKLDLGELQNIFQLTVAKLQYESAPHVRRTEIFDLIPGWIFLLVLLYVLLPGKVISASHLGILWLLMLLVLVGLIWELYRGRNYAAEHGRFQHLAVAEILANKPHDYEALNEDQVRDLNVRLQFALQNARPWRVPVMYFPWFSFARELFEYAKSRLRFERLRFLRFLAKQKTIRGHFGPEG